MNWYYMQGGERKGPVNIEGLRELLQDGEIDKSTMVWNKSMGDQWTKAADVTVLAGPQENVDDPKVKEDFKRKMEERQAAIEAQKKASLVRGVIAGVSVVVIAALTIAFVKSAPKREWGMSAANPICSLDKLEQKLINEYQMERKTLEAFEHFSRPAAKLYEYSEAKKTPGEHVSGKGIITVAVDADDNVKAIVATFPSPGLHGPTLNNRSVGSLTMNALWLAHGGAEEKALLMLNEVQDRVGSTGFVNVPADAVCQILEKDSMRAVWAEHGPNTRHSMVYFGTR